MGIPVYDADQCVHDIYAFGGEAVPLVKLHFPSACEDGYVNRSVLSKLVVGNDEALKTLETIVHPLVHERVRAHSICNPHLNPR